MNKPTKSSAGDGVTDQFPAGLRVLVVDDDPTCLMILEKMLRNCQYEVTKCNRAETALSLLRENRSGFDIVISDVHMPDMDGFKLLEHVGLEIDLPVIMMSADDSKNVVMKGVTHGACDYLIKPVRIEALKNIWQHVVRKRKNEWRDFDQSGSREDGDRQLKPSEDADISSSTNEGNWKNAKRRKDEEDEAEERDDTSTMKKPRVVWSVELHQQFLAAVNQLGIDKAVPKKILELMNVPGLSRENVASHLQKYRLYLRRLQHQNGLNNNSFVGIPESPFRSLSSLNGIDLQALAATCQISTQNLTALRAAGLSRSTTKSGISMPLIDQRNLFSFETPNNSKQINLLHGIPTSMQSKQLANFHQPSQSFGGMNMQGSAQGSQSSSLLVQTASRPQIMNNDANSNHLSRLPSSIQQSTSSSGMASASAGLMRNGMVDSARIGGYNSISQAPPVVDFSINRKTNTDFPGNNFPLANSSGMSTIMSKGMFQAGNSDIFHDVNQNKPQNWDLPNVGVNFDASQHANIQGSLDVTPSVLVHQGFSIGQNCVQNGNMSVNPLLLPENSLRVKTESLLEAGCQNPLFPEQFGQEDLMSALLKQEQEGIGPVFNEFGFDGYPLDNLPVQGMIYDSSQLVSMPKR